MRKRTVFDGSEPRLAEGTVRISKRTRAFRRASFLDLCLCGLWVCFSLACGNAVMSQCSTVAMRYCGNAVLWQCGNVAMRCCGNAVLWQCSVLASGSRKLPRTLVFHTQLSQERPKGSVARCTWGVLVQRGTFGDQNAAKKASKWSQNGPTLTKMMPKGDPKCIKQ